MDQILQDLGQHLLILSFVFVELIHLTWTIQLQTISIKQRDPSEKENLFYCNPLEKIFLL